MICGRLQPPRGLSVLLMLALSLPRVAVAVLFYSTADPAYNTNAPTGVLTNSGWQFQGRWGLFLGTVIAPKYFITAAHVGGIAGDFFHFRGVDYSAIALFDDPNSDLRLWRICGTFPGYADLYSSSNETGQAVVVFGRGTQRGEEVVVPGAVSTSLKGWQWGPQDGIQRWGTNLVSSISSASSAGDLLKCNFDASGGPNEAHLSVGDSGGGVFIKEGAVWKLAGINYAVDSPYNTNASGAGFNAAIFDEGGLYKQLAGNWVLTPDLPQDLPGGFYATRVSAHLTWINSVVQAMQASDPPPSLFSSTIIGGPYHKNTDAVADPNTKTVTLPIPPSTRFYRLLGCDPTRISSINTNGTMLIIAYQ